jgi:Na+-transporting NADH:ubiquinone oxidoreductase subunit C
MKDSLKTIIFAAVLGVVCAGLLAAANRVLKPYQKANEEAEKWRNIFGVLGVSYNPDANSRDLLRLVRSAKNPGGVVAETTAAGLTIFTYNHPEAGRLCAVEFSGPGLWGPIDGLLCLKSDLKTVYNIAFYKQEETPGLGGEIGKPKFLGRFPGKTIAGPGDPGIRIVKNKKGSGPNAVDGITAATLTCDKVEEMINKVSKAVLDNREAILKAAAEGGDGHKESRQ